MNILVSNTYSPYYDELAAITTPNHLAYCRKHGYEYNVHHAPYNGALTYSNVYLIYVKEMLKYYDIICTIDTDTAFINTDIKIEDVFPDGAGQMIARENLGGSPYNNGVMFWRNAPSTTALIDEILNKRNVYGNTVLNWQGQLGQLISNNDPLILDMRVVPENLINCFPDHYKKGDYIIHAYCMSYQNKIIALKKQ